MAIVVERLALTTVLWIRSETPRQNHDMGDLGGEMATKPSAEKYHNMFIVSVVASEGIRIRPRSKIHNTCIFL
jgi:hypothetical protein